MREFIFLDRTLLVNIFMERDGHERSLLLLAVELNSKR